MIFVNPYEGDLALIGTTDIPVEGDPEAAAIDRAEIDYLLGVLARYFRDPPAAADIVHSFSGVGPPPPHTGRDPRPRPAHPRMANPSAVTRDYVLDLEPARPVAGRAPLLSVFGGKITTYRKLAEHALDALRPHLAVTAGAWTAAAPLPGGDIPEAAFAPWLARLGAEHRWLPPPLARHYGRLYGTRAHDLLRGAHAPRDLGRHFGGGLYEREVRFLLAEEWAMTSGDILWRRTKHGLHLSAAETAAFAQWLGESTELWAEHDRLRAVR